MKRKDPTPIAAPKPIEAEAEEPAEDMIVATPRHHLLDEFAARPRLRPGRSGGPRGGVKG